MCFVGVDSLLVETRGYKMIDVTMLTARFNGDAQKIASRRRAASIFLEDCAEE
jgi:hypothetical protein